MIQTCELICTASFTCTAACTATERIDCSVACVTHMMSDMHHAFITPLKQFRRQFRHLHLCVSDVTVTEAVREPARFALDSREHHQSGTFRRNSEHLHRLFGDLSVIRFSFPRTAPPNLSEQPVNRLFRPRPISKL